MSELTLTLLRLGLLALLWIFVFSVVGVLRTDIYGTTVSRRSQRRAQRQQEKAQQRARPVQPVAAPQPSKRSRGKKVPTTLVVTEGPLAGTSLPLRQSGVLIGRNPECALVLDDDYASGRHARIFQSDDGQWMVEDLRSTNGTFLGATRLTEPRDVAVGSVLRIGQTVVELQR